MGNYSKLWGFAVGAALAWGASKGLPAELAGEDMNAALTVLGGIIIAWRFPANKPPA